MMEKRTRVHSCMARGAVPLPSNRDPTSPGSPPRPGPYPQHSPLHEAGGALSVAQRVYRRAVRNIRRIIGKVRREAKARPCDRRLGYVAGFLRFFGKLASPHDADCRTRLCTLYDAIMAWLSELDTANNLASLPARLGEGLQFGTRLLDP